jgi:hypothetical protein
MDGEISRIDDKISHYSVWRERTTKKFLERKTVFWALCMLIYPKNGLTVGQKIKTLRGIR